MREKRKSICKHIAKGVALALALMMLVFTGSSYGYEFTKEDGFHLEYRDIENKEEYFAVFMIEDIYGNTYTSDFFNLAD